MVVNTKSNDYNEDELAYLRQRRRAGLLAAQFDKNGATFETDQPPIQDNWRSIGYGPNTSSMPVDMTRVVTMDKPIPAVVKLPIDTRHPSRAVATVERDIYGGDGRTVVIERGSTLIGTAASIGSTAEEKVGIAWERLMRPDGSAWALTATSGDAMGRSGVIGFIDNRWMERFGTTLLASAMVAGIDIALNASQTTTQSATTTSTHHQPGYIAAQEFNGDFRSVFAEFAKEQMEIQPIRTVPVGTRITVFPTTDLWLRPITPNDDMRRIYAATAASSPSVMQQTDAARAAIEQLAKSGAAPSNPNLGAAAATAGSSANAVVPTPNSVGVGKLGYGDVPLTPTTAPAPPPVNPDATAAAGQAGFATDRNGVDKFKDANPNPVNTSYGSVGYNPTPTATPAATPYVAPTRRHRGPLGALTPRTRPGQARPFFSARLGPHSQCAANPFKNIMSAPFTPISLDTPGQDLAAKFRVRKLSDEEIAAEEEARPTTAILRSQIRILTKWLSGAEIEEIAINRPGEVWQRLRHPRRPGEYWIAQKDDQLTYPYLKRICHLLANSMEIPDFGPRSTPVIYGTLPSGHRFGAGIGYNIQYGKPDDIDPSGSICLCVRTYVEDPAVELEDYRLTRGQALKTTIRSIFTKDNDPNDPYAKIMNSLNPRRPPADLRHDRLRQDHLPRSAAERSRPL